MMKVRLLWRMGDERIPIVRITTNGIAMPANVRWSPLLESTSWASTNFRIQSCTMAASSTGNSLQ